MRDNLLWKFLDKLMFIFKNTCNFVAKIGAEFVDFFLLII